MHHYAQYHTLAVIISVLGVALVALLAARTHVDGVRTDACFIAGAVVLGVGGELLILSSGQYRYVHPDIAGVPYWLIPLWAYGAYLIRRTIVAAAPSPPPGRHARNRTGAGEGEGPLTAPPAPPLPAD